MRQLGSGINAASACAFSRRRVLLQQVQCERRLAVSRRCRPVGRDSTAALVCVDADYPGTYMLRNDELRQLSSGAVGFNSAVEYACIVSRCKMMHRQPKQNKRDDNGADVFIGQDLYALYIITSNFTSLLVSLMIRHKCVHYYKRKTI